MIILAVYKKRRDLSWKLYDVSDGARGCKTA